MDSMGELVLLVLVVLMAMALSPVHAAVVPHELITDGAVLQQGMRVPIWGSADDGEKVTVEFQGQEVSTTARNGWWMVHLDPLKAGGPFAMTIKGKNTVEIRNILVGEVWVCSGQSNMQFPISAAENPDEIIAKSADPMLRLFYVPKADMPRGRIPASWRECGPDTVGNFSAVGYHFGRELRKALGVPIGLICSAIGGTPAEAWTNRRALKADPKLSVLLTEKRSGTHRPACLYNAMIAPLQPYGIRGVIWYQGESNAARAYQYRTLFPTMIRSWREGWGQGDFPFLFVQLAPYGNDAPGRESPAWAELREAQLLTSLNVPNTEMAVITDLGDAEDIHPKPKGPVGIRLALAARAKVYGEDVVYSGPIYKSMEVKGHRAYISFDHVGSGLMAADGPLTGFTIAGEDGKFVKAQAEIIGDKVVVSNPAVVHPTAVRFGWANFPEVNLYNKEGLPASPFRTDDLPMVTEPK